jgi:acrylyl-CoA reductase (NADPH)
MGPFTAFRIHEIDKKVVARFDTVSLTELSEGDVVIRVRYSSINYKDALAATGAGRILKRYPLVGGIDLAGTVVTSLDTRYTPGDEVLVTGCGLSETRDGGYAQYARIMGDCVIQVPKGLTSADTMRIGTAGFTAALAIHRMEQNGQTPDAGPIVVTGATGGVGSIAIDMLHGRGYQVVAVSGKTEADAYLRNLGATRILRRQEIPVSHRPLEAAEWGGAVDNVGGAILSWLTRTVNYWGNIASIGLAGSPDFTTSVMPFILRGVNLLGINSVANSRAQRLEIWNRIASDLKPRHLDLIAHRDVAFNDLPSEFATYGDHSKLGRALVTIG